MTRKLEIGLLDTDNGDVKVSYSYVNPAATDANLYTYVQKMAGLTTNTLVSVKKIDETILIGGE